MRHTALVLLGLLCLGAHASDTLPRGVEHRPRPLPSVRRPA